MKEKSDQTKLKKSSIHKGVSWHVRLDRWHARIRIDKKVHHVGYFKTENEAVEAIKTFKPNNKNSKDEPSS